MTEQIKEPSAPMNYESFFDAVIEAESAEEHNRLSKMIYCILTTGEQIYFNNIDALFGYVNANANAVSGWIKR